MVTDSIFDEQVRELEIWIKNHKSLPEKIGEFTLV